MASLAALLYLPVLVKSSADGLRLVSNGDQAVSQQVHLVHLTPKSLRLRLVGMPGLDGRGSYSSAPCFNGLTCMAGSDVLQEGGAEDRAGSTSEWRHSPGK